jgi:hypothetical protein
MCVSSQVAKAAPVPEASQFRGNPQSFRLEREFTLHRTEVVKSIAKLPVS